MGASRAATELLQVSVGAVSMPDQIKMFRWFQPDGRPLDPDDTPSRRAVGTGLGQKGRILRYEHDGRSAWMPVDAYLLSPTAGSKSPVLSMFADTTEQHDVARLLAASEERLRLVIESSRELISVVDNDGLITFTSPSTRDILGYAPNTTLGTPISRYIDPEDVRRTIIQLASEGARSSERVRARHFDGSIVWLETLATVLTDDDGAPTGVLLSSRDITERLVVEQQLEAERQLLHATIRGMHAGVLAVDDSGSVIEVNAAFREITGANLATGNNVHEFAHAYALLDDEGNLVPFESGPVPRALAGTHTNDEPFSLRRDDGQVRHLLARRRPSPMEAIAPALCSRSMTSPRSALPRPSCAVWRPRTR